MRKQGTSSLAYRLLMMDMRLTIVYFINIKKY